MKNPSPLRSSRLSRLISDMASPTDAVMAKPVTKVRMVSSPYSSATAAGSSIARLKTVSRIPVTRRMTAKCMKGPVRKR